MELPFVSLLPGHAPSSLRIRSCNKSFYFTLVSIHGVLFGKNNNGNCMLPTTAETTREKERQEAETARKRERQEAETARERERHRYAQEALEALAHRREIELLEVRSRLEVRDGKKSTRKKVMSLMKTVGELIAQKQLLLS